MTGTGEPPAVHVSHWRVAEENAARWLRHWGYTDATVTPPGADHGIDVSGRDVVGQVKYEAAQIGRSTLQRLVGAAAGRPGRQLVFFSGAGYSSPAVIYAGEHDIALFTYDLTGRMQPINGPARQIASTTPARSPGTYATPGPAPVRFETTPEQTFRALYAVCQARGELADANQRRLSLRLRRDDPGARAVLWVEPAADGRGSEISYRVKVSTRDAAAVHRIAATQHQRVRELEEETERRILHGPPSPPLPQTTTLSKAAALVLLVTAGVMLVLIAIAIGSTR